MTAELVISMALSIAPAWCTSEFASYPEWRDDVLGIHEPVRRRITISQKVRINQMRHVVMHECAHSISPEELPDMFGKPPFVTPYAATNPHEDFAETAAVLLSSSDRLASPVSKFSFIRRILRWHGRKN
jgi:hypothetical protein